GDPRTPWVEWPRGRAAMAGLGVLGWPGLTPGHDGSEVRWRRRLRPLPALAISPARPSRRDDPARTGAPMAAQYIFQMQGLSKTFPGGKKLFENIWLSFYPDAKIGVVGVNGSGKSTLMKIMAGIDGEFTGEARAADGTKMGYLEQEPQLDKQLNVWGNVIAW